MTTQHVGAGSGAPDAGDGPDVPNHHAHFPGFSGPAGLLAAATMVLGRGDNARLAERLSGLGPGDTVIDVGCGPGAAVRHAARLGASTIGVDPAPVMLRLARILTRSSLPVRYLQAGAEALPLPDAWASVVWSIASVHHWTDLDAGLREARRVLRPAGRLVAIERLAEPGAQGHAGHGWTDAQADAFARQCLGHGFVGARVDRHQHERRRGRGLGHGNGNGPGRVLSVTATAP
jgi:SAM-dependent methyltransferase